MARAVLLVWTCTCGWTSRCITFCGFPMSSQLRCWKNAIFVLAISTPLRHAKHMHLYNAATFVELLFDRCASLHRCKIFDTLFVPRLVTVIPWLIICETGQTLFGSRCSLYAHLASCCAYAFGLAVYPQSLHRIEGKINTPSTPMYSLTPMINKVNRSSCYQQIDRYWSGDSSATHLLIICQNGDSAVQRSKLRLARRSAKR